MRLAFDGLVLGRDVALDDGLEDVLALVLAGREQVDLIDLLAGLVLEHQMEVGVACRNLNDRKRISVVGRDACRSHRIHCFDVRRIVVRLMLDILCRRSLQGDLVILLERAEIGGELRAVLKDHPRHVRIRCAANDVDVLFVIRFVCVLVQPGLIEDGSIIAVGIRIFRGLLIDVELIDRLAGLVLHIQNKSGIAIGDNIALGSLCFALDRFLYGLCRGFRRLFGSGNLNLCKLRLGRFNRCRVDLDRRVGRIPLVDHEALCKRFRKVVDRLRYAVVILDLDVVRVLCVLQRDLVREIAAGVRLEPIVDRIGDIRAVVKRDINRVVVGMRTEEALEEIHAAFLGLAGHQRVHLGAVRSIQVVDHVVVGFRIAAFFIEPEAGDVLAGLVLELNGDQLIARIEVVVRLAARNEKVHSRPIGFVVVRLMLEIFCIRALEGELVVHRKRADLLRRNSQEGVIGKLDVDLHRNARFTDDVDVLFVVLAVDFLVLPVFRNHAVAHILGACRIDKECIDRVAGLVLDVQRNALIGACGCIRRFGRLIDRRFGRLIDRRFRCFGLRFFRLLAVAGNERDDHQQHEHDGK